MKLIWTKSNLLYSILIRLITGEPVSHFAIVFESENGGLLFEANLLGTHPKFYKNFKKHCTIVYELDLNLTSDMENIVWDKIVNIYDDKQYDYLGALYLGWRTILKRVFGIPKPLINAWAQSQTYYCDDIYDALNGTPGLPILNVTGGMDTPYEVYQKLSNTLNNT